MAAEPAAPGRAFLDTNVILYLLSDDPARAETAERIVLTGGDISVQVLAELTSVARRKAKLEWAEIAVLRDTVLATCTVHPVTIEVHRAAVRLAERDHIPIYDAQIVAAALDCGATHLLSEDFQTGRVFEGRVTVINPFLPT